MMRVNGGATENPRTCRARGGYSYLLAFRLSDFPVLLVGVRVRYLGDQKWGGEGTRYVHLIFGAVWALKRDPPMRVAAVESTSTDDRDHHFRSWKCIYTMYTKRSGDV